MTDRKEPHLDTFRREIKVGDFVVWGVRNNFARGLRYGFVTDVEKSSIMVNDVVTKKVTRGIPPLMIVNDEAAQLCVLLHKYQ